MARHQPLKSLYVKLVNIDKLLELAGAKRYTPRQIEAHMAAELAAAPGPSWAWRHRHVLRAALFIGFICSSGYVIGAAMLIHSVFDLTAWSASLFTTVIAASYAIVCIAITERIKLRGPARWVNYEVGAYVAKYGPLPASARTIVNTAAIFAPRYTPWISVLENNKARLDPVLYLEAPSGHRRAVDIWH